MGDYKGGISSMRGSGKERHTGGQCLTWVLKEMKVFASRWGCDHIGEFQIEAVTGTCQLQPHVTENRTPLNGFKQQIKLLGNWVRGKKKKKQHPRVDLSGWLDPGPMHCLQYLISLCLSFISSEVAPVLSRWWQQIWPYIVSGLDFRGKNTTMCHCFWKCLTESQWLWGGGSHMPLKKSLWLGKVKLWLTVACVITPT